MDFVKTALNYKTEMLVLFVSKDYTKNELFKSIDKEYKGRLSKECNEDKFHGKYLQKFCFRLERNAKRLCLLGYEDKKLDKKTLNALAGKAAQTAKKSKFKECAFIYPLETSLEPYEVGYELIYASNFSVYDYSFKSKDSNYEFEGISILSPEEFKKEMEKGMDDADIVSYYNSYARDLVNLAPSEKNPEKLSKEILKEAKKLKLKTTVLTLKDFRKKGMNAIEAVGRGSKYEPKMIILEYTGSIDKPICFVGKGITFDSGGLNIKPSASMEEMKADMSGAATVVGTLFAAKELKLKKHIIGIIGLAENMLSGDSYKQGDILKAYNGKTIEVLNTDAEGRLVLADCLSYAEKHYSPKYIIDYATLTGAVVVALGSENAGLFSNDIDLTSRLICASEDSLEKIWQMPLDEEYEDLIKSDIADVRNVGKKREAGSITAALFLKNFVEKSKWAHIDIAGTAFHKKEKPYSYKGATGFGVRLNIEFLKN
ncbi:leucyl aminopeptidase [Candidatus Micrarchaeota archaeon]|jgi:leucyl aminopeptidase|nr:leucyl aminopeptidase [Candidatus Micrarchaeota archaeon]